MPTVVLGTRRARAMRNLLLDADQDANREIVRFVPVDLVLEVEQVKPMSGFSLVVVQEETVVAKTHK
jgi:hypothetical protein